MRIINIGKDNSTYQQIVALRDNRNKRSKLKMFYVEGIQNIKDALANNWEIEAFIYSELTELSQWAKGVIKKADINYVLSDQLMKNLCGKTETCEIVALVRMRPCPEYKNDDKPIFVLLDRPSKKGNLGTIIRSCDAFNVAKIFYSGHGVDIYDPAVITASMGSFFKLPIEFIESNDNYLAILENLRKMHNGLKVVATSLQADESIYKSKLDMPVLLLVGNETDGLSHFYTENADERIIIPMNEGIDSLNVACATTVCLYEINRQRI